MQIAPGLHSLTTRKGGNVHAYLVETLGEFVLIDTLYDDAADIILDYIDSIGRKPSDIKRICLTHSHKSHLGGLAAIHIASGAPVLAHDDEAAVIEGRAKAKPVGFALPRPFNLEVYSLQVALNLGIGSHRPVPVDGALKEGYRVGSLEVISVPGHTSGCVAFWDAERKYLIAGDALATWPTLDCGWRTFNLDQAQAQRSVGKMAELQPTVVCVGHGDPIQAGAADTLKMLADKPI